MFSLCVAVLMLGAPGAQERPPIIPAVAEITRLLESPTPRDQAWGAWFAAQARATQLSPLLRQVASAHRTSDAADSRYVADAALDALIQLGTPQPPAWARTFFDRRPAESLILLSRADGDPSAELMDLASTQTGIRWLTTANLLLARRPSGFAALLLRDLEIDAHLTISTNDEISMGGLGADASAGHGGGGLADGFPPLAHYYLDAWPHPGAVVLVTGPKTIYFTRNVSSPGQTATYIWHDTKAPTSQDRLDYIARLLNPHSSSLALKSGEWKTVKAYPGLSLDKEAAAFREDVLSRYKWVVAQLVGKNLLTEADAAALPPPRIVVTIHDKR